LGDELDATRMHLNHRDATLICFSRAPIDRLVAYSSASVRGRFRTRTPPRRRRETLRRPDRRRLPAPRATLLRGNCASGAELPRAGLSAASL
jgi:hypothetical protein